MNAKRRVLLLEEAGAAATASAALTQALQAQGADVRRLPLAPPYEALLDALADGWLPVLMRAPPDPDT